jgi:DNA-binding XRE family transcriptional regulator
MNLTIQSLGEFSKLMNSSVLKSESSISTEAGDRNNLIETSSSEEISLFITIPAVRSTTASKDIDDFIGELLKDDPALGADLSEGRKWVADALYESEPCSLKALRLRAGLSQVQLAERVGLKQPNISEIESGKRTPSLDTLQRLAQALEVSVDDILKGIRPLADKDI